jgi:hypothetical protein
MDRCDSLCRSEYVNLRRGLAAEDVQKELTRGAAESSGRFGLANCHPLVGSGPNDLEPGSAQSATQVAATSADVSP